MKLFEVTREYNQREIQFVKAKTEAEAMEIAFENEPGWNRLPIIWEDSEMYCEEVKPEHEMTDEEKEINWKNKNKLE